MEAEKNKYTIGYVIKCTFLGIFGFFLAIFFIFLSPVFLITLGQISYRTITGLFRKNRQTANNPSAL